jgi:hypothetical protein
MESFPEAINEVMNYGQRMHPRPGLTLFHVRFMKVLPKERLT